MKLTFSLCIVFLLTAAFSPALFGQSDSKNDANTSKENPDIAAAKRSLSDFGELLKASNWEEIKNQISKTGQNALVKEVCYSLAIGIEIDRAGAGEDQLPPGLNKIIKSIEKVKDKYELDEVAKLMFEGETQKAMAQLDTSGKKWEIVDAIWKAQSGSPFHLHPAVGKVEAFEVDGDTVFLDVKMEPVSMEPETDNGDAEILMDGPPQVVRMKKLSGEWKYDGVDEERTMARMEKFMAEFNMGGMEPPELLADPSFTGKSFDDQEIKLEDYKGKVVVLDFWGTWCGPCVAAMPSLKLIQEAFKNHGVEFIGIASDEKEAVRAFCIKNKIPWPNIIDKDGGLANKFGVRAFPTMMVIGKDGVHLHADIEKKPLVAFLIKHLELDEKEFSELKAKLKAASEP